MNEISYSYGDIVEAIWDDISVSPSWIEQSEIDEAPKDDECKAVGYFVHKSAAFLILAGISGTNSADLNAVIHIPIGTIKSHRKLS